MRVDSPIFDVIPSLFTTLYFLWVHTDIYVIFISVEYFIIHVSSLLGDKHHCHTKVSLANLELCYSDL